MLDVYSQRPCVTKKHKIPVSDQSLLFQSLVAYESFVSKATSSRPLFEIPKVAANESFDFHTELIFFEFIFSGQRYGTSSRITLDLLSLFLLFKKQINNLGAQSVPFYFIKYCIVHWSVLLHEQLLLHGFSAKKSVVK